MSLLHDLKPEDLPDILMSITSLRLARLQP